MLLESNYYEIFRMKRRLSVGAVNSDCCRC